MNGISILAQRPNDTNPHIPRRDYVHFSPEDFQDEIDAIPAGSSSGQDGITAVMLKKAKIPISRILCLIFEDSIDKGMIPDILKKAFIIPVDKGG